MCSCLVKLLSVTIFLSQKFCYSDLITTREHKSFTYEIGLGSCFLNQIERVSQLENYKTFSTANIAAKGISWVILFHAAFYFCMYGCRSASSSIKSSNCWLVFEFPSAIFFFFFFFQIGLQQKFTQLMEVRWNYFIRSFKKVGVLT